MQADPTLSSFPRLPWIPAQAGIQGMDTGLRRYDEEKRASGVSSMEPPFLSPLS